MKWRSIGLALPIVLALLASGCGGGGSGSPSVQAASTNAITPARPGDSDEGKRVFYQSGCETCHALADAGSITTGGPDLDRAQPSRELIIERVLHGKGTMNPYRSILTDQEIADLTAYILSATRR